MTIDLAPLVANTRQTAVFFRLLTPEQWQFSPSPEVWTAMQTLDHLWVVDTAVTRVLENGGSPIVEREGREKQSTIEGFMGDRSRQYQAPQFTLPTGRFADPDTLLADWETVRAGLAEKAALVSAIAQCPPHPYFGPMTAQEWVDFVVAHTTRHVEIVRQRLTAL